MRQIAQQLISIGLLGGLADNAGLLASSAKLFLLVGVLGGFTTFLELIDGTVQEGIAALEDVEIHFYRAGSHDSSTPPGEHG